MSLIKKFHISKWPFAVFYLLFIGYFFFESIIVSSVAIGLMGFASFPIFVTWLEPIWFKKTRKKMDWVASFAVVFGLWLLLPGGWVFSDITLGLILGIASGLSFALLVLANRTIVQDTGAMQLAFWQNSFATLVLMPFIPWATLFSLTPSLWFGLAVMGIIFTALSHTLFMFSLKRLSAQLASITATLEPVYGILLATILLGETISQKEFMGIIIILSTTFFMTILQTKTSRSS